MSAENKNEDEFKTGLNSAAGNSEAEKNLKDDDLKKEDILEKEELPENKNASKEEKKESFFREWILPAIIVIIAGCLIRQFVCTQVYIPSSSMVPTLNINDRLIVTRIWNKDKIERGDILVFDSDELHETLIKRVIGLPGDKISIEKGMVKVNNELLEENYVKNNDDEYKGEFTVPEDKLFFLGDNRPESFDSRYWNNPYIDEDKIWGKAKIRIYPFNSIGSLYK